MKLKQVTVASAPPFSYWGYNVQRVWDPGFNQWGLWVFGVRIPL